MGKLKFYYGDRIYCQNREKYKGMPSFCFWLKAHTWCLSGDCKFYKDLVYDENYKVTHIYCSFEPEK